MRIGLHLGCAPLFLDLRTGDFNLNVGNCGQHSCVWTQDRNVEGLITKLVVAGKQMKLA